MKSTNLIKAFICLCISGNLLPACTHASASLEWVKKIGTTNNDQGCAITVDAAGNAYTTGYFSGTADFDPGAGTVNLTSAGGIDIFVCKTDAAGNLIWAKNMGGPGDDRGFGIAVDGGGNIYTTGSYSQIADFDPGTGNYDLLAAGSGVPDIFISKLDAAGNFVWAKGIGTFLLDQGYGISADHAGHIYLTGDFMGTVDFDPGTATVNLTTNFTLNAFVAKFDTTGNFVWARNISTGSSDAHGKSVKTDASGNVYTTGYFSGTADFNPDPVNTFNLTAATGASVFISKLDAAGNFVWAKHAGSSGTNQGLSLATDPSGNIYTTGFFQGTADFDPGSGTTNLVSAGNYDAFLSKTDPAGNLLWAYAFGGGGYDYGYAVVTDPSGNVYLTGGFQGKVDFNPGSDTAFLYSTGGNNDVFVCKLNSSGSFLWAAGMGGGATFGMASAIDAGRNIYTTGYFTGSADFDPGTGTFPLQTASLGDNDIFIHKMSQASCNSGSVQTISACDSFILNSQTYKSSGTYTQTRANAAGCDSIITLRLTIANNTGTLTTTACDSFRMGGQRYTTSGVYTHTFTNAAGCDSVQTVNLTVNHSTSHSLTESACDHFTLNNQTYTTSGTHQQTLTNAAGCDSTITLQLTINKSTRDTVTENSCEAFSLNGQTYTTSGTYMQNRTSTMGCDSVLVLHLTINAMPDTSVIKTGNVLTAAAPGIRYQWVDCDLGYAPISGATSQSYTASRNGNYALVVSENNCSDTSGCISITGLTGISGTGTDPGIQAYPNPANSTLHINTGKHLQNASVTLRSLTGQVMMQRTAVSGTLFGIDVSGYPSGIYFLEILDQDYTGRIKITRE